MRLNRSPPVSLVLSVFLFLLPHKFFNFDFIFARFVYLLPRQGLLILPFSIMNRSKPIFSYYLFVTFWGQLLQQDRCRCRSRWGNLDRGQDRI